MRTFQVKVAGYRKPKYEEHGKGVFVVKGEEETRTYTVQAETHWEAADIAMEKSEEDKDFYPDEVISVEETQP